MTSHELARELLKAPDLEVAASIDISTGEDDYDRRIHTFDTRGVNFGEYSNNQVMILFDAEPKDNYGKKL